MKQNCKSKVIIDVLRPRTHSITCVRNFGPASLMLWKRCIGVVTEQGINRITCCWILHSCKL